MQSAAQRLPRAIERPSPGDARKRRNERQRRYERRLRDGVGLYPVELTDDDIDMLIDLEWLDEGDESDRTKVGKAVVTAMRTLREIG
jgi:hypothetical protein